MPVYAEIKFDCSSNSSASKLVFAGTVLARLAFLFCFISVGHQVGVLIEAELDSVLLNIYIIKNQ